MKRDKGIKTDRKNQVVQYRNPHTEVLVFSPLLFIIE
jgi:hypothetical protein